MNFEFLSGLEILQIIGRLVAMAITYYFWKNSQENSEETARKWWRFAFFVVVLITIIGAILTFGDAKERKEREMSYSCNILSYSYNPSKCTELKK